MKNDDLNLSKVYLDKMRLRNSDGKAEKKFIMDTESVCRLVASVYAGCAYKARSEDAAQGMSVLAKKVMETIRELEDSYDT